MQTKKEMAAAMAALNLTLPDNWSKLSTERALTYGQAQIDASQGKVIVIEGHEPDATKKPTLMSKIASGLKIAREALLGQDAAFNPDGKGTMPRDPNWGRGVTYPWPRRKSTFLVAKVKEMTNAEYQAASRQVRRADDRRDGKMPVGMSQGAWHKAQGFGKVRA